MQNRLFSALSSFIRNIPFSFSFKPQSDVLFITEGANWVTSWEIKEISRLLEKLGISFRYSGPIPFGLPRQSIFFANRYNLMLHPQRYFLGGNRIAFPYYHGHPDSGERRFIKCYENLRIFHNRISRIQVTNSKMYELVISTGIDPSRVHLIPIGINTDFFPRQTGKSKRCMRDKYGIPESAVVIGSFQKDGHGWSDGELPKLEKGPDIFLKTLKILKNSIPNLFILLSGPARGYVIKGLGDLKIPFKHIYLEDYPQIGELYQCLDLYLVTSREEGGPKAILESMASGVPLVTTRVGQAIDLVKHEENGWIVDVGDTGGLAHWTGRALGDSAKRQHIIKAGIKTAQSNTYDSQLDMWKSFFTGFVDLD